ncbi:hypothetical protein [Ralstonia sp. 24A2]|uniref:hypothetical protein n=1 Tax=Ralstonia sp. 24A2 TaxID=3447364 RepID=UPI003F6A523B
MQQRGKILRDTHSGTGLIIVDGRQHAFTLEGIWRSSEAPAVNMTVDAQFDETGTLTALFAVPDAQLAREKADEAMAAVKNRGRQLVAQSAALAFGGNGAADMVGAMTREAMRAFSIGAGGYLGCAVSLYFAAAGVLKFLAKRG